MNYVDGIPNYNMASEQKIEKHKLVEFKYRIIDDQGTVIEQIDTPVTYVHGTENGMFEKIENALAGAGEGDVVKVEMSPQEGFGEYSQELTYTDDIANVPEEYRKLDVEVDFQNDRGEVQQFRVTKFENGKLTFDGNHPLAGKNLTFHIDVISMRDATAEEIQSSAVNIQ